jgi:hypothetical protein
MKRGTLFVVWLLSLAAVGPALADGKFYGPRATEELPPEIPYQRALLMYSGGEETLILQSQYKLPGHLTGEFGWVVPVPSVPELASMEAWYASQFFEALDMASMPDVFFVREQLPGILALLSIGAVLALPLVFFLAILLPRIRGRRPHWRFLLVWALLACLGLVYSFFTITRNRTLGTGEGLGVEVITAEQVGIYDVQVIRSRDATELIDWLSAHQFDFGEEDTAVFEDYLQRGWCFVVATVDAAAGEAGQSAAYEGLVAPLILRFQAEAPVYPLALTATAGHETQVLLYLLGEQKWQDDGRLDLYFAGSPRLVVFDWIEQLHAQRGIEAVDPVGFFADANTALPYLCRFKGTLSAREMREDLTFVPAEDNQPYRRWMVRW